MAVDLEVQLGGLELCFDENLNCEIKYVTEAEENSTTIEPCSNVSCFW